MPLPIGDHLLAGQRVGGSGFEARGEVGVRLDAGVQPPGPGGRLGARLADHEIVKARQGVGEAVGPLEAGVHEQARLAAVLRQGQQAQQVAPGAVMQGALTVDHHRVRLVDHGDQGLVLGHGAHDVRVGRPHEPAQGPAEQPVDHIVACAAEQAGMAVGHGLATDVRHAPGVVGEQDLHSAGNAFHPWLRS